MDQDPLTLVYQIPTKLKYYFVFAGLTGAQPAKPVLKPVGLAADKSQERNGGNYESTSAASTTPVKKVKFETIFMPRVTIFGMAASCQSSPEDF